jgi:hypothetical protein
MVIQLSKKKPNSSKVEKPSPSRIDKATKKRSPSQLARSARFFAKKKEERKAAEAKKSTEQPKE